MDEKIKDLAIDGLLSLKEVCKYLKVGRRTALAFIKQNNIKHLKVGREYKIIKTSLVGVLEA